MRVFVLGTGRCGSVTFSRACEHLRNYTVGHETRWGSHGEERLDYADNHIEVDNRLSWHLGELGRKYPDATYVHLKRDPELVALSFARRWRVDPPHKYRSRPRVIAAITLGLERLRNRHGVGIIEAYAYNILGRSQPWTQAERLKVCRAYVETVNCNIETFLHGRNVVTIDFENAAEQIGELWHRIGAEGDLVAAISEFGVAHNSSS